MIPEGAFNCRSPKSQNLAPRGSWLELTAETKGFDLMDLAAKTKGFDPKPWKNAGFGP